MAIHMPTGAKVILCNGYQGVSRNKKGLQLKSCNPLILLARPARFERATLGFVVRKIAFLCVYIDYHMLLKTFADGLL